MNNDDSTMRGESPPEVPQPSPSCGGPKTASGKKLSSKNSLKHGLTTVRTWSGAELVDVYNQSQRLAGQLGITSAQDVNIFYKLFLSRDRDMVIAMTENLLLTRSPASADLATVRPPCLQDNLSVSALRTLKRQTVRQGRIVTKNYDKLLALTPADASVSSEPVAVAEEFFLLAEQLKIAETDHADFFGLAAFVWNVHPPVNRLALQITLDLIMDEWRLIRLQVFSMKLLNQLTVSVNDERHGHDFALLQDAQGFNAMEVLQDLEAALNKRIENRGEQLALANAGPWPALAVAEPVTAIANDTEGENQTGDDAAGLAQDTNQAETEAGVDDPNTPAAAADTRPDKYHEL